MHPMGKVVIISCQHINLLCILSCVMPADFWAISVVLHLSVPNVEMLSQILVCLPLFSAASHI